MGVSALPPEKEVFALSIRNVRAKVKLETRLRRMFNLLDNFKCMLRDSGLAKFLPIDISNQSTV